jgi:bacterioferritin-associated ferredoxin
MIVCICNAIRECEIREVARTGVLEVETIYRSMGCEPRCCQCLPFAQEIVEDEMCVTG